LSKRCYLFGWKRRPKVTPFQKVLPFRMETPRKINKVAMLYSPATGFACLRIRRYPKFAAAVGVPGKKCTSGIA
ncbi:MAG: hypothetical protein SGI94_05760, partial [Saprospiraceae bacterium]|nr:hypothetical protein [Saprospiraceae bacterium]